MSGNFEKALHGVIQGLISKMPHAQILSQWDRDRGTDWFVTKIEADERRDALRYRLLIRVASGEIDIPGFDDEVNACDKNKEAFGYMLDKYVALDQDSKASSPI